MAFDRLCEFRFRPEGAAGQRAVFSRVYASADQAAPSDDGGFLITDGQITSPARTAADLKAKAGESNNRILIGSRAADGVYDRPLLEGALAASRHFAAHIGESGEHVVLSEGTGSAIGLQITGAAIKYFGSGLAADALAGLPVMLASSSAAEFAAGTAPALPVPPDPIAAWCELEDAGSVSFIRLSTGGDVRRRSATIRVPYDGRLLSADYFVLDQVEYAIGGLEEVGLRRHLSVRGEAQTAQ